MQWYECWHSEGVAPQFTKPPLFSLEEMGGYYYTIGMLNIIIVSYIPMLWLIIIIMWYVRDSIANRKKTLLYWLCQNYVMCINV